MWVEWTCNWQRTGVRGRSEAVEYRRQALIGYRSWGMIDEQVYILLSKVILQEAQAFKSHVDTGAHE